MTRSKGEAWLGVTDVARGLGLTMRAVYRLIDVGELPAYRIDRVIRIRRTDFEWCRHLREEG